MCACVTPSSKICHICRVNWWVNKGPHTSRPISCNQLTQTFWQAIMDRKSEEAAKMAATQLTPASTRTCAHASFLQRVNAVYVMRLSSPDKRRRLKCRFALRCRRLVGGHTPGTFKTPASLKQKGERHRPRVLLGNYALVGPRPFWRVDAYWSV